jgi:type IV pilus biogenesis protein CpaD/CtpE
MRTALAILAACLLAGCASTPDPKPAGAMLDPVTHQEIIHVTVDNE